MRAASRGDTSCEKAASSPATKKIVPAAASGRWKRRIEPERQQRLHHEAAAEGVEC